MKSKPVEKKRKARDEESDSESDDELANGLFDGVLEASEDEEDYIPSDEIDDVDSESEVSEGSEDAEEEEEEEGDDDALLSDDIPSDDEMGKLSKDAEELEITEPGVDPKPKHQEEEDRNYKVVKDANGGERYVYEYVEKQQPRECEMEG